MKPGYILTTSNSNIHYKSPNWHKANNKHSEHKKTPIIDNAINTFDMSSLISYQLNSV